MSDPEKSYYDQEELSTPEVEDETSYEAPESPYMPQINQSMEDTHARYARLWEQYSSEQGVPADEEPEEASDEGMRFAEETPEKTNEGEGGGMSAAA